MIGIIIIISSDNYEKWDGLIGVSSLLEPTHLNMDHDVIVHLHSHVVDVVVRVVVHNGVGEHEHHVALELGCRPQRPGLDVLFNHRQVHRSEENNDPKLY